MHTPTSEPTNLDRKATADLGLSAGQVAFRRLVGVGCRLAPGLVARLFQGPFLTPRKSRRTAEEERVLAAGRREVLSVGGMDLCVRTWGSGPGVVLVHGWGGHSGHLSAFVEPLVERGLSVTVLDLPGHGDSAGAKSSIVDFARGILGAADRFGPFSGVIAHSFGCAGVTYALSMGLNVQRAVFLAPVGRLDALWARFAQMTNMSQAALDILLRRIEKELRVELDAVEPMRLAPAMQIPLLVVHDLGDPETSVRDARRLAKLWPNASFVQTRGLGHRRVLRDPESVARAVCFVAGVECLGEAATAGPPGGREPEPPFVAEAL